MLRIISGGQTGVDRSAGCRDATRHQPWWLLSKEEKVKWNHSGKISLIETHIANYPNEQSSM
jgi:hypothetical protein